MKIGIIGYGNMGQALIFGMIKKGYLKPGQILISDQDQAKLKRACARFKTFSRNKELVDKSDVVILAVKPQQSRQVLAQLSTALKGKLLISICAGVSITALEKLAPNSAVIRVMPNIAIQLGQGISALALGRHAEAKDKNKAAAIFSCVGEVIEVKERLLDAVTAVSGSGPAYFFFLTEALIASAVRLGINTDAARKLAVKTAMGSAALMTESKLTPGELRKQVTSKGGTTEAAFTVFAQAGLGNILSAGIKAAVKRSKQLSR